MTADLAAVILIVLAAPAANIFTVLIVVTTPWWRTLLGRALVTQAVGLALLIDVSLLYRVLGEDYPWRDPVRLSVYLVIVAGVWMSLLAFLLEKRRTRRRISG